jgi:dephospho-CoA kinase
VVGLTGGLASGKSLVANLLTADGTPTLDADAVVHRLYEPGEAGALAVAEIFGPGILDREGGVDRGLLGGRVLRDRELRLTLESVIHPLVREEIARWVDGLRGAPVAVVEASLLVETGSYRNYDLLLVVWCRREQQLERARERGMSEDRARDLIEAQMPLDDKRQVADVVIDNSKPVTELAAEVERAWDQIAALCDRRGTPR